MESRRLILIVDDDSAHRYMLATVLSNMGFCNCEASDGSAALKTIREGNIDFVLMDIHMKNLSGLEALAEIKAFDPRVPVLLMTAYCSSEDAAEAHKNGAMGILNKPLNIGDLKHEINLALMQDHPCFIDPHRNQ